ncbi:MAG: ABC transporter substrate-binding protein [Candidatus Pristimantibacillus sp.]
MTGWKKSLFLVLALMLVAVSALAGCAKNDGGKANDEKPAATGTAAPEENKGDKEAANAGWVLGSEPLSFSLYGHYDWYTMPQWGQDESSKWIKENKKVDITGIQSGGNAAQKLNTMIASGELPDVLWLDRGADVERLRAADMLVPFDDYLDKYPNFKKWVGEETINMLRSSDGKIYQFPNWYTAQPLGNAGYVLNKKIYEELGSPTIETTDDFYNYLKAVKEKFPDVTPFNPDMAIDGQGLDVLYTAFGEDYASAYVGNRAVPNGDKLTSLFMDPVFRESMQFASKLFREKLMTQDALTQTKDQVKEDAYNGTAAVFAGASPLEYGSKGDVELKKKDPNAGYIAIWPIHKPGLDKNKIFAGSYTQLGWNVSVITKKAKDPEKIFAFYDYLTGPEGTRTLMWGPEGIYWDGTDEEGSPLFTEAYTSDVEGLSKMMDATVDLQWTGNAVFMDTSKMKYEKTLPVEKQNWESRWQSEITWKTAKNTTEFINMAPPADSEEGIIASSFEEIYKEARAKALYAKSDEEVLAIFDKAEKDAQAIGYDKLLAYQTIKWQENVKKIQGN